MGRIVDIIRTIRANVGNKALGKALSISALNQIVSSGTNFAFGIYLVRTLAPAEFGLYGIGFAISLFYFGIGYALFVVQMVVHAPDKSPADRVPYAGRMLSLLLLFCVATVLVGATLMLTGRFFWQPMAAHTGYIGAIMAASVATLLKDFFVRHAYNERRETWALAINFAVACAMGFLIWAQHASTVSLNEVTALSIYAMGQAVGAISGYMIGRPPVFGHRWNTLVGDMREALHGGKWASFSNLVFFARIHAHTIVVAALLGPVGVAKLNAARLLVTPAVVLIPALSQVAMPRLAAARKHGLRRMMNLGSLITIVFLIFSMFYCSILLISYDIIVDLVLGDRYQNLWLITAFWCIYACFLALRNGVEIVSQVQKQFLALSRANTFSALASLAATYYLTTVYSLTGALTGLIIGEALLFLLIVSHMLAESREYT